MTLYYTCGRGLSNVVGGFVNVREVSERHPGICSFLVEITLSVNLPRSTKKRLKIQIQTEEL